MKKTVADEIKILTQIYSPEYPCPLELFAGRKKYIDYFDLEILIPKYKGITPQPPNTAFLGQWGMGKTTLLRYFANSKEMKGKQGYLNILVGKGFQNIETLLEKTLKQIAVSTSRTVWVKAKINERLKEIGVTPFTLTLKKDNETLTETLIKTWEVIEKGGVQHCSLLIDDFHRLPYDQMLTLRDILQTLPDNGCNYSTVVTGTLWTFMLEHTEPVSRFFKKKHLLPFTSKEIKEIMWKPVNIMKLNIDFEQDIEEEIEKITMGHPYFVKFFILELAKKHKKIEKIHVHKDINEIIKTLGEAKFKEDYGRASAKEQKILTTIVKQKKTEFEPKQLKNIKGYTQHINRLLKKELLIKTSEGIYSIYHPLFKEWIQKFVMKKNKGK